MMHTILISNFCFNPYKIKTPLSLSFCGRTEDSSTHLYKRKPAYNTRSWDSFQRLGRTEHGPTKMDSTVSPWVWPLQNWQPLFLYLCLCLWPSLFCLPPLSLLALRILGRRTPLGGLDAPYLFLHLFVSGTQSLGPARRLTPTVSQLVGKALAGSSSAGVPSPSPAPTPSWALFPPPQRPAPPARPPGRRSPLSAQVSPTPSPSSFPVVPRGQPGRTAPVRRAGEARR